MMPLSNYGTLQLENLNSLSKDTRPASLTLPGRTTPNSSFRPPMTEHLSPGTWRNELSLALLSVTRITSFASRMMLAKMWSLREASIRPLNFGTLPLAAVWKRLRNTRSRSVRFTLTRKVRCSFQVALMDKSSFGTFTIELNCAS